MFNQGFKARLSVVVAVILRSIGNNTPSNTPRINVPASIEIKQCNIWVLVTIAAKIVEDTIRIIVWTPNGSGNIRAKTAKIPTNKDSINALE
jgi:hypothetical protein